MTKDPMEWLRENHDRIVLQSPDEYFGEDKPHETSCRYCANRESACPCCWATAWCPVVREQVALDERFNSNDCQWYQEAVRPPFDLDD